MFDNLLEGLRTHEAVVLRAMVYYGERIHNRITQGKDTLAECGRIHAQDGKSSLAQGMPHRIRSFLQQVNTGTHTQCFCPVRPARHSVQGLCWELVIQALSACVISHNHRNSRFSEAKQMFTINQLVQ